MHRAPRLASILVLGSLVLPTSATATTSSHADIKLAALHHVFFGDVITAAEHLDERHYGFRPTAEVRTFAEQLGHIATASYTICAFARDQAPPEHGRGLEQKAETLGKAGLLEVLRASRAFCDQAMEAPRTTASPRATQAFSEPLFAGESVTTGDALAFQLAHLVDHYGNLSIYLRLLGEVPPSTQRAEQRAAERGR